MASPANYVLLMHLDGNFTDATGRHTPTASGSVVSNGTNPKFGAGSANFSGLAGSAHRIDITPQNADFAFGTGDFTIDLWVYMGASDLTQTGTDGYRTYVATFPDSAVSGSNAGYRVLMGRLTADHPSLPGETYCNIYNTSGTLQASLLSGQANKPTSAGWYHLEVDRASGTLYFFQNGTLLASTANSTNIDTTSVAFGQSRLTPSSTQGNPDYIDEIRVVKGEADHTASFTPATAAYDFATTVDLTGQSSTAGEGSLFIIDDSVGLPLGLESTAEQGTLSFILNNNITLTGQAATAEQGVIDANTPVFVPITGLTAVASNGGLEVSIAVYVPLFWQRATTQQGSITVHQSDQVALTGQTVTAEQGTLIAYPGAVNLLSGQNATAAQGLINVLSGNAISLSGLGVSTGQGDLNQTNTVSLVGQGATAGQGVFNGVMNDVWTVISPDDTALRYL